MGHGEAAYVAQLADEPRRALAERLCALPLACLVVTHGAAPHPDLASAADRAALPLFATPRTTLETMDVLRRYLEERLAPSQTVHGTLMDIYGVGVLILGESGIGKSESALELVLRGHRLVSDDTVTIRRIGTVLNGAAPDFSRYHIELRGLGILNIKDLFGVASVRERKDIDLVVKLDRWQEDKHYDRLGLEDRVHPILGLELPFLEMPVGPGRSLSVLLEVAARHHLLKARGYHAAKELAGRLHSALGRKP
jgi:HPr kinase/phosphorylase